MTERAGGSAAALGLAVPNQVVPQRTVSFCDVF